MKKDGIEEISQEGENVSRSINQSISQSSKHQHKSSNSASNQHQFSTDGLQSMTAIIKGSLSVQATLNGRDNAAMIIESSVGHY